jgi:lipoprotein-anchoring transpeptidase ErfK/SrfK
MGAELTKRITSLFPARRGAWAIGLAAILSVACAVPASARRHHQEARPQQLTAESVNAAKFDKRAAARRPSALALKAQVLLDRQGFSPGAINARAEDNFTKALAAFQRAHDLAPSGKLDADTWEQLAGSNDVPALVDYTISNDDVKGPFTPSIPKKLEDMSTLENLDYTGPVQLLAEKFHISQSLLRDLNRGRALDQAGSVIIVPNVRGARDDDTVARVEVDKKRKAVRAFAGDGTLVAFYPASIGSKEKPAPSGTFRIRGVAERPTYHYDPKFQFKGVKADYRFTVRPGPNNPAGMVWIDLSKPSYGIHGTPDPTKIGKTQSHGCIRLTNWDALDLAHRVRKGVQVAFLDE